MKSFWPLQSPPQSQSFKGQFALQERKIKAESILLREPKGKFIPALVEGLEKLDPSQKQYKMQLCGYVSIALERDITVAFVIEYLRKIVGVRKDQSIFVESGKKIVEIGSSLRDLYERDAGEDGFIYLKIRTEHSY